MGCPLGATQKIVTARAASSTPVFRFDLSWHYRCIRMPPRVQIYLEAGVGHTGYGARDVQPQSGPENSFLTTTIWVMKRMFEIHWKISLEIDTPRTVTLGICSTKPS